MRTPRKALPMLPDKASDTGRRVTHRMTGTHRAIPPFRPQVTLHPENSRWRAAPNTHAPENSRWPLILTIAAVTDDEYRKGTRT